MTLRNVLKGLAAALLLVFTALALPAAGQSAQGTWSTPVTLGPGWWQSVAVDTMGTAHVSWYSNAPGTQLGDALFYTARPLNGDFAVPRDVLYTGDGGYTVRNQLAATSDGLLHVAYRGGTDHYFSQALIEQAYLPLAWSRPQQIDSGYYVTLLADDQDTLHVVTSVQGVNIQTQQALGQAISLESDPCAFCADLIYRRSADSGRTWSQPVNLSNTLTGSEKQSIWQGPSGRLYVIWDEGYDWYIGRGERDSVRLVYSEDDGLTWSDPIILDGGGSGPFMGAGAELADGSLLVVWRKSSSDGDRAIYSQRSADLGASWSEPEAIPGVVANVPAESVLDDFELVLDDAGITHLFAVGFTAENPNPLPGLYHIEYRQGQWRSPTAVYYDPTIRRPEWPRAVIGPQNDIHLTWFIRFGERLIAGESGLSVMYSYRSPTLPDRPTQEFRPTAAPPPTAAVAQRFEPTLTPFPTAQPIVEQVNVRTTSDTYAIQTLLAAVLVSAVLGGVVLIARGFRLRR
jgi:hypothetical protein